MSLRESMPRSAPRFSLASPAGGVGAVAVIELRGVADEEAARVALPRLGVGEVRLADLLGIDRGVVCRLGEDRWLLTPHGGAAVVACLVKALGERGFVESTGEGRARGAGVDRGWKEAQIAAAELSGALARAASPLAIDLLIEQPRRWAQAGARSDPSLDQFRQRLLSPPLVVAVGAPNIGKSSLLNALAGRDLAIVADEPGTTRDHVGALIDMGGLVVRYIDTPGLRHGGGAAEEEAIRVAYEAAARADLVLACSDYSEPPLLFKPRGLRVGLRADLGPSPGRVDIAVSAATGAGIAELVAMIRERLVPAAAIADRRPWRFWDEAV